MSIIFLIDINSNEVFQLIDEVFGFLDEVFELSDKVFGFRHQVIRVIAQKYATRNVNLIVVLGKNDILYHSFS